MDYTGPNGFVLSDSAIYAFRCQEVYPDVVSFAAAIPDHLKQLFLIPIQVEFQTASVEIASRLATRRLADGMTPTGDTDAADMFGTNTFVNHDNEPNLTNSEPGSIFQIDDADDQTHHQEYDFDQNIQVPTETTFNSDIDLTESGMDYPYNTKQQVRHSSEDIPPVLILKLHVALTPESLETHVPPKIKENAKACTVSLISYDKGTRVFTFSVDCGNGAKHVQAKLSEIDHVSMSCNCPFWRWNGPEFHAKENSFMLDSPFGMATPPDIRDPDRKYWLCKHAYAVIRRLDNFVQEVVDENWDVEENKILDVVDKEWDRLEGAAKVPLEEIEKDDVELDVDWDDEEGLKPEEAGPALTEEEWDKEIPVDVDLSELGEDEHEDYEVDLSDLNYEVPADEQESEEDYEQQEQEAEEDYEAEEEAEEAEEDYEIEQKQQEEEQQQQDKE